MNARVLCVALAMALTPIAGFSQDKASQPPTQQPRLLQAENGRFVFGQISEYRRDQFMLDTRTGRLWKVVVTKVGKPGEEQDVYLLDPLFYVGQDGKWSTDPK